MASIMQGLEHQQHALTGLLEPLDDDGWRRPTRCEGWDVADVVLHLAQTNELAMGSATGRLAAVLEDLTAGAEPARNVDDGAALMVARQRGAPTSDLLARWRDGAAELRRVLLAADHHERVTWVAGELSIRTLAGTRLAETWIHTGDVADVLGSIVEPTDHLHHVARLAWRTLPYAFARAGRPAPGPVAFHLLGPTGEPWKLLPDQPAATTIAGAGVDLCLVAARRVAAANTALTGTGPDADAVLELVRTYA
jgi:uncharacterized protein (TIGR03084 family)